MCGGDFTQVKWEISLCLEYFIITMFVVCCKDCVDLYCSLFSIVNLNTCILCISIGVMCM